MTKLFSFALVVSMVCLAVTGNGQKAALRTITSVGITAGQSNPQPLYQLSAGVTLSRMFAGGGVGYDQYRFNSVPVFADWRLDFGKKQLMFVYTNFGYNFPTTNQRGSEFRKETDEFNGGIYFDGGFGFRMPAGKRHAVLFSAGVSRKELSIERGEPVFCLVPPCPMTMSEYRYALSRFIAKLSWEFGRR